MSIEPYKILNHTFNSKKEITAYCISIKEKYRESKDCRVTGDDKTFMMKIFSFHPRKNKVKDVVDVLVLPAGDCFFIRKESGYTDDISIHKCIYHIPFNEDYKMDYVFRFGKYKGQSIYDIEDTKYLHNLLKWDKLWRSDKVKIGQYLRYGYIPYHFSNL